MPFVRFMNGPFNLHFVNLTSADPCFAKASQHIRKRPWPQIISASPEKSVPPTQTSCNSL